MTGREVRVGPVFNRPVLVENQQHIRHPHRLEVAR